MSENYEYCYECGLIVRRIGLDDEPNEYAHCDIKQGCNTTSSKTGDKK